MGRVKLLRIAIRTAPLLSRLGRFECANLFRRENTLHRAYCGLGAPCQKRRLDLLSYESSNDVSVVVRMQPLKLAITSEVLLGGRDKTIGIEQIFVRNKYLK
jgi:hypothetical protein